MGMYAERRKVPRHSLKEPQHSQGSMWEVLAGGLAGQREPRQTLWLGSAGGSWGLLLTVRRLLGLLSVQHGVNVLPRVVTGDHCPD